MSYWVEMPVRFGSLVYLIVSFIILTIQYTGPINDYQKKSKYEMLKVMNTTY